jgi:hypothetical protein
VPGLDHPVKPRHEAAPPSPVHSVTATQVHAA